MSFHLIDGLPDSLWIAGEEYPINSNFRASIAFELTMTSTKLSDQEKALRAVGIYFPWKVPSHSEEMMEAIMDFYCCGEKPASATKKAPTSKRIYSFRHDYSYICAAFLEQYGIDLTEASLHWWKFRSLFRSLSESTLFAKIMGWRSATIDANMSPQEKKRLKELKTAYALPIERREDDKISDIEKALLGNGDLTGILQSSTESNTN